MSDGFVDGARARIHAALQVEAAAGYPHLTRITSTAVVQFLDFLEGLPDGQRDAFFDQQAEWWAATLGGRPALTPKSLDLFGAIRNAPGPLVGGPRYTAVRDWKAVATFFGSRDRWKSRYSGRQLELRRDLIPHEDSIRGVKATMLRKIVTKVMVEHGYTAHKQQGELGFWSDRRVLVSCDFGTRGAQFRYDVVLDADTPTVPLANRMLYSYERLWGLWSANWDLLTEENAERSLAILPDLVGATVALFGSAGTPVRA